MSENPKTPIISLHSLIFTILYFSAANSKTNPSDIQALSDLKNGVDPTSIAAGSCLSSWDFSFDPCDRLFSDRFTCGFRCDKSVARLFRVTEITLDPVGYSGQLSSISWNLPYLENLDVSDNSFFGSIPDSLSNLTRLRRLVLSKNKISGEIPLFIGSIAHLEEIYLDNNYLTGSIPASINNLIRLKRLEVQQNNITGEIPDLRSLKNLYYLDASDNQISGRVPADLPPSTVEISIRNNKLSGNSGNLNGLPYLQVLDLSYNELHGAVSSNLFNHPSLQQLTLSHNNFNFLEIPSDGGASSSLIALDLSSNDLRGFLPAFLASLPKLSALSLENNKFSGMIPILYALRAAASGGKTSPFGRLLLGGNYLFGPIPGPLMGLKPGSVDVSLVDNCLYRCPGVFFFCQGGDQKSLMDCRSFSPVIP